MNDSIVARCGAAGDKPGCRRRSRRFRAAAGVVVLMGVLLFAASAYGYVPGQRIWTRTIGTSTSDAGAWVMAAGPSGSVVITGWQDIAPTGQEMMVAKYDTAGHRKWSQTYTTGTPGTGYAQAVACDKSGNVYVAGSVNTGGGAGPDIMLVKYDAAGNFQWAQPYDGPGNGSDNVYGVAVDPVGNIVVVGDSLLAPNYTGIVVLKYDANGTMVWPAVRYDPDPGDPNAGGNFSHDLTLDANGDIYVAGDSEYRVSGVWTDNLLTLKFAGADGHKEWGQVFPTPGGADSQADAIAVRGQIVVVAAETYSSSAGTNGLVVRYDPTTGAETRHRIWNTADHVSESFSDVAIDRQGSVYVTGDQWKPGTGMNDTFDKAVTAKFSPTLGKTLWIRTYLPTTRPRAFGDFLALDSSANAYVGGGVDGAGGHTDFLLMKYSAGGVRKWLARWSANGPDDDEPGGLILGPNGSLYFGGQAIAKGDFEQAVLLKYKR